MATTGDADDGDIADRGGWSTASRPSLQWLRDQAWPLWLEHGIDWNRRAFHEHLDLTSLACGAVFRRLRVAARQTYVFSKAAAYGVPGAAGAVALGLDFLRGPARLADGGFARRFDLDNRPIDHTRDLYDHAFVLLAFASASAVAGAEGLRRDAIALVDFISANFAHPDAGYQESIPHALPRRQNPHMHLFEALLAAHAAFGDELFFARASELAEVFLCLLFQPGEGALPELFDEALKPCREAGRFQSEPGHHYEWIWLLDWYNKSAAAMGLPVRPAFGAASDALLAFADRYALDPHSGLVVNGIWSDGAVQDGGFRLWPQTERLKAEARRENAPSDGVASARAALAKHLVGVRPGLWIERLDELGRGNREPAPATSLYHLTAALTDGAVLAFET
jgi:mannose/cellobiose epimerase-like protein (N-acyl-D-glucosamine 2-epimerase family)